MRTFVPVKIWRGLPAEYGFRNTVTKLSLRNVDHIYSWLYQFQVCLSFFPNQILINIESKASHTLRLL